MPVATIDHLNLHWSAWACASLASSSSHWSSIMLEAPGCLVSPAATRDLSLQDRTLSKVPGSLIHIFNKQFIYLPGLPACILSIHHRCWIEAIKMPFKAGPGSLIDADDECRAAEWVQLETGQLGPLQTCCDSPESPSCLHCPPPCMSIFTTHKIVFTVWSKKIFIECQNIKKVQNILKKKCIWIYCPLCVVTALRRDSFVSAECVLTRDGTIVRVPAHSHHHPRHQDRDELQHHPPSNLLSGFWR